jgi:hypothetical protein
MAIQYEILCGGEPLLTPDMVTQQFVDSLVRLSETFVGETVNTVMLNLSLDSGKSLTSGKNGVLVWDRNLQVNVAQITFVNDNLNCHPFYTTLNYELLCPTKIPYVCLA